MLRIGIVGLGHVFEYQLEALKRLSSIDIIALCDSNIEKKPKADSLMKLPFYEEPTAMIQNEMLDIVMISTPPNTHWDIVRQLKNNGVTVLVEKPLAMDIDSYRMMIEDCKPMLLTAFHARYAEDVSWFLKHRDDLLKSSIKEIHCRFYDPYCNDRVNSYEASLGGSWLDSGVNALSVVERILDGNDYSVDLVDKLIEYVDDCVVVAKKTFAWKSKHHNIKVVIETDWTKKMNHKSTEIILANNSRILLNHSEQSVIFKEDEERLLYQNNDQCRLINHYENLFLDIHNLFITNQSNLVTSKRIHDCLFMDA